ncbi:hypothetical protein ATANTOWER_029287 [Ataeniobius toweri]|uniref:Uncharacterized protein n=1 Tax=Ataeniobius toweri TaxID=208326 RepID=A0ABU7B4S5_9TELE|nr:hypothetical protein [Ataeniobius toweri]
MSACQQGDAVSPSSSAGDLCGRGVFVGTRGFYSNSDVTGSPLSFCSRVCRDHFPDVCTILMHPPVRPRRGNKDLTTNREQKSLVKTLNPRMHSINPFNDRFKEGGVPPILESHPCWL